MKNIIPTQKEGNKLDCFETVEFTSTEIASEAFIIASYNLLAVNEWHKIAELPAAVFKLVDNNGLELHRPLQLHDYIKIDIPGQLDYPEQKVMTGLTLCIWNLRKWPNLKSYQSV